MVTHTSIIPSRNRKGNEIKVKDGAMTTLSFTDVNPETGDETSVHVMLFDRDARFLRDELDEICERFV